MKTIDICPTILNAKNSEEFLNLLLESNEDTLEKVVYIHLDVMDKDFVKGEGRALEEAKIINGIMCRSLTAQWEHQILVTATGYEILTLSKL